MVDHEAVTSVLRRFAGTLVGEYDLEEVLSELGADVARIIGCAGAGVMLADEDDQLRFVATSDPVLDELEALQIELDEGPCLLAYRTDDHVVAGDLEEDDRFRQFGPRAVAAGMQAVYSFPMRYADDVIGALNLYAKHTGQLDDEALEAGRTFADVASIYVLHGREQARRDRFTAGLQHALDSRVVVEQAKGWLSAREGVTPSDAFELLRAFARSRQVKAAAVARAVLSGDLDADALRRRPGGGR